MAKLAPEIEAYCERAGMDPGEPHRLALVAMGKGIDRNAEMLVQVGTEAAGKAADGAMGAVRSEIRRLIVSVTRARVALYVAVPLVTGALGWWAGYSRPVATPFGELSRGTIEAFRTNDLEAAYRACAAQPPQKGREWCKMSIWRPQAPPAS